MSLSPSFRGGLLIAIVGACGLVSVPAGASGDGGDPPPVTEPPRNCDKGAFGAAPWRELRYDVEALLDLTSGVAGLEQSDAAAIGAAADLADLGLADHSSDMVVYTAFAEQEIVLLHLAVASGKSDRAAMRKRAKNEDRLEQELVGGFVASGLDETDLHTPILWSEFPLGGRDAKDGRFTVDTTSGPMTANVVVFTQRCGENLLGAEVIAMWPCAECAGVPWILGPEVAQSLSYRLANL